MQATQAASAGPERASAAAISRRTLNLTSNKTTLRVRISPPSPQRPPYTPTASSVWKRARFDIGVGGGVCGLSG
jgi:hypothetical protein